MATRIRFSDNSTMSPSEFDALDSAEAQQDEIERRGGLPGSGLAHSADLSRYCSGVPAIYEHLFRHGVLEGDEDN